MKRSLLVLALCAFGLANCSGVSVIDTSPVYAMDANDATVVISGCGNQPVVGYTYCRLHEGQDATKVVVSLVAPPTQCKTKPCVTFKIFNPQGQLVSGLPLPDGQIQVDVKWSDLIGSPIFSKGYQGFWQVVMEWTWVDSGGNENQSAALGEIRLRVVDANYVPLQAVHDDKNFAWRWQIGDYRLSMTTKGRSSVYGGRIP